MLPIYLHEIDAKEAHTEEDSLMTVLNGQRNVGFISIKKSMIDEIKRQNLKIIPVRMQTPDIIRTIIYREESKADAFKLYKIAQSKDGYLSDKSPEEAREIGELLGYSENSINEYIYKRYIGKLPTELDPDDFNDLHETLGEINKEYTENTNNGIFKQYY